ncbi:glycoside hydrolase family 6 protein [Isoptericola sp. NPDC058082]|uniref:glycoside hydrolase family 6 protein n=1 Tax=Isoptericola sp. NPDC058082 TaxID=3346331 RepID=UPI0036EF52AB
MRTERRPRPTSRVAALTAAVLAGGAGLTAGAVTLATSAAGATTACEVDYAVTSSWQGGFQADVTLTNLGDARSGWEVSWQQADGDHVSQVWNGRLAQDGAQVRVADAGWNGTLATGATASFGLIATSAGAAKVPASFSLDGVACTGDVPTTDPSDPPTEPTDPPTDEPGGPADATFFVDEGTQAWDAWQAASGTDRALLEKIATTPQASWVTDADPAEASAGVADYTGRAAAAGATPLLAVYAIPGRDCGSHSGGGTDEAAYRAWVEQVAGAMVGEPWVVLEPDALPQLGDCDGQGDRVGMLADAARILDEAGARVYLDVGHSAWLPAAEAASRLQRVGLEHVAGFALNVSNYRTTDESRAYGEEVSALLGGVPFVVDTSRNGNGSNGEWCNPRGRALGERPAVVDDDSHLDALLWVKLPGESDGACNGGPAAGAWWQEIALELARNASW